MNEQLSLFGTVIPGRTMGDYWDAEIKSKPIRLTSEELQKWQEEKGKEYCSFWFFTDVHKCCGCYPIAKHTGGFADLSYCECIVCGRKTKPIDDYSWLGTKKAWERLFDE